MKLIRYFRNTSVCAAAGLMLLSGCGVSRDKEMAEKMQQLEQSVMRAESAAVAAEKSAKNAEVYSRQRPATDAGPASDAERDMEKASQDPDSAYFNAEADKPEG